MSMSRRDYRLIAETIASMSQDFTEADNCYIAETFAQRLSQSCHGFDLDRFLTACGHKDYTKSRATGGNPRATA